jgi:uncharacterized membrane protein
MATFALKNKHREKLCDYVINKLSQKMGKILEVIFCPFPLLNAFVAKPLFPIPLHYIPTKMKCKGKLLFI